MIRVLLLEMTGLAADLVQKIVAQHEDIEIVGSLPDATDLRAVGEVPRVQLVITEYPGGQVNLRRLDPILASRPGVCALAVEDGGRAASLYALKPYLRPLGPLSAERLVEFIRTCASRTPA